MVLALVGLLLVAAHALATPVLVPIPGIVSTGVGLAQGAIDVNYLLISSPAGLTKCIEMRSDTRGEGVRRHFTVMNSGSMDEDCLPDRNPASDTTIDFGEFVPKEILPLENPQTDIPRIAKDERLVRLIESAIQGIPTTHRICRGDARQMRDLRPESVHLVLTSPPYWTLKEYRDSDGQMGHIERYEEFLSELDKVWAHCYRALVPGGRLVCVVGDVCLSRRQNAGRHTVVPLHASIQEHCRLIGFDNLAPIIWHKISNAVYEVDNGPGFLGKPYEPNSVIKNDVEFILMERKPGGYRTPGTMTRVLSVISADNHRKWFQQIWTGLTGASTRYHPAPYPLELADRLIRMFSFVGDTVLDPFLGTGTTTVAAAKAGRNSIGLEIDEHYFDLAHKRIANEVSSLFSRVVIHVERQTPPDEPPPAAGAEIARGNPAVLGHP